MVGRILVVEDNTECRQLLALFLARIGYEVVEAANGVEGVEKAIAERPQLVLMDLKLPLLGGIEATSQIKEHPFTKEIPVIICTAFGPEVYKDTSLVRHAAEIIRKPIKLEKFQLLLEKYIPQSPGTLQEPSTRPEP